MSNYIINEKQLSKIQEVVSHEKNFSLAEENWTKFSKEEKDTVVECLKHLYPEKSKLINEAAWYNTLGDVIGLFDPTGVVDLVNGISYISQGDNLFGFLSMISAVPYIGDVIAKPLMGALKVGAPSAKALEGVLKLSKAGKTAEASAQLSKLTAQGGLTAKFVQGFSKVAGKLRGYIERMPSGVFKGLKNTILQWFDLFANAAKSGTKVRTQGQGLAKLMKGPVGLSTKSQAAALESLIKSAKSTPGIFSGYRTTKGVMSWKTLFGGMPQLIGRNKSVRALMRQTKWWLGFLDYLGLGNWVGPDEVIKQMGETEFNTKLNEYQKTPQAKDYFEEQFGQNTSSTSTGPTQQTTSQNTTQQTNNNPFADFMKNMLLGKINPIPGN
jgi:hypothetical protein